MLFRGGCQKGLQIGAVDGIGEFRIDLSLVVDPNEPVFILILIAVGVGENDDRPLVSGNRHPIVLQFLDVIRYSSNVIIPVFGDGIFAQRGCRVARSIFFSIELIFGLTRERPLPELTPVYQHFRTSV